MEWCSYVAPVRGNAKTVVSEAKRGPGGLCVEQVSEAP
jgi:hypothetical protein